MIEVALGFLGSTNPRSLHLSDGQDLAKLKKFFKDVFVTFTHRKSKKKIESIVPHGGHQQFEWNKDREGGVVQNTTIQVRSTPYFIHYLHGHCD